MRMCLQKLAVNANLTTKVILLIIVQPENEVCRNVLLPWKHQRVSSEEFDQTQKSSNWYLYLPFWITKRGEDEIIQTPTIKPKASVWLHPVGIRHGIPLWHSPRTCRPPPQHCDPYCFGWTPFKFRSFHSVSKSLTLKPWGNRKTSIPCIKKACWKKTTPVVMDAGVIFTDPC